MSSASTLCFFIQIDDIAVLLLNHEARTKWLMFNWGEKSMQCGGRNCPKHNKTKQSHILIEQSGIHSA